MEPLAYFITWTTYGTWLPGDQRGWVDKHEFGIKTGNVVKEKAAQKRMNETAITLNTDKRMVAENAIKEACNYKGWKIHALNIRTNHIHIVISGYLTEPSEILRVLKAYSTRTLNMTYKTLIRKHWWTKKGSIRHLTDKKTVNAAIEYTENQ